MTMWSWDLNSRLESDSVTDSVRFGLLSFILDQFTQIYAVTGASLMHVYATNSARIDLLSLNLSNVT